MKSNTYGTISEGGGLLILVQAATLRQARTKYAQCTGQRDSYTLHKWAKQYRLPSGAIVRQPRQPDSFELML